MTGIWHNKFSFNFGFSDGHKTAFFAEKNLVYSPIVEPLTVASFVIYFDPKDFVTGFRFWNCQNQLLCEAGECNFQAQRVDLEKDERIIGVRSYIYN